MNSLRAGVLIAAVVAGPPLWSLVQAGSMDEVAAVQRGAVVAIACAWGVSRIQRMAAGYTRQQRRTRPGTDAASPPRTPPSGEA